MTSVLAVVITIATSDHSWARDSIGKVKDVACRHRMPTDKVTYPQMAGGHQYHIMYGLFLVPLVHRVGHSRPAKMLEIGLGCGMNYGAGASALLWRELFSQTELELWEAEVDKVCVEKAASGEGMCVWRRRLWRRRAWRRRASRKWGQRR